MTQNDSIKPDSDRPDLPTPIPFQSIPDTPPSMPSEPTRLHPKQSGPRNSARPRRQGNQGTQGTRQQIDNAKISYARIILFMVLLAFFFIFIPNPIALTLLAVIYAFLSIKTLEPIQEKILDAGDSFIKIIGKPLWNWLFVKHLSSLGRWLVRHRRAMLDVFVIVVLFMTIFMTVLRDPIARNSGRLNDFVCLKTALPWFTCNSGIGIIERDGVRVGLVKDNSLNNREEAGVFDHTTFGREEREIEELIFAQNSVACEKPHITLVVVTMLSRSVEIPSSSANVGLQELRGAYLAQKGYNDTNPEISLCLAIANLGTADTADTVLPQIVHQLLQFAHFDPTVRGFIGFPFSHQASGALAAFKKEAQGWPVPIISPSASSDDKLLSNSLDFYRVVSPNSSQSKAMGEFFCSTLLNEQTSVSIVEFNSSEDEYSNSLYLGFDGTIKESCLRQIEEITVLPFRNGDTASIREAIKKIEPHVRYIFFPGYNSDLDTLEVELWKKFGDEVSQITVLGGDGLFDIAGARHYAYTPVYSTVYASQLSNTHVLVRAYREQGFPLPYNVNTLPDQTWLPSQTIYTYDATTAFIETLKNLSGKDVSRDAFKKRLSTISFTGANGNQIAFQGNLNNAHSSDPATGFIYLTCTDRNHVLRLIDMYQSVNKDSPVIPTRDPVPSDKLCT